MYGGMHYQGDGHRKHPESEQPETTREAPTLNSGTKKGDMAPHVRRGHYFPLMCILIARPLLLWRMTVCEHQ